MFLQIINFMACLIAILIFGTLLLVAIEGVIGRFTKLVDRFRYDSILRGRKELGTDLSHSYHWFSESPEAMALMDVLSNQIKSEGYFNSNNLRDLWREKVKEINSKRNHCT